MSYGLGSVLEICWSTFYTPEGWHIVFELSVRPSFRPKFNLASKMHTLWRIFLKLGMHIACDEFYILLKVKVTEVMAATGA